jgi:hypothetical protein
VDLDDADLSDAKFRGADLRGADLRTAKLSKSAFFDVRWDVFTRWPTALRDGIRLRSDRTKDGSFVIDGLELPGFVYPGTGQSVAESSCGTSDRMATRGPTCAV